MIEYRYISKNGCKQKCQHAFEIIKNEKDFIKWLVKNKIVYQKNYYLL